MYKTHASSCYADILCCSRQLVVFCVLSTMQTFMRVINYYQIAKRQVRRVKGSRQEHQSSALFCTTITIRWPLITSPSINLSWKLPDSALHKRITKNTPKLIEHFIIFDTLDTIYSFFPQIATASFKGINWRASKEGL